MHFFIISLTYGILALALAVFVYAGIPYLYDRFARSALKKKAANSSAFLLTFDDGPSDTLTPAIMDLLDQYNLKASFFVLGRNISGREDMIRQIVQRGHELCFHGYDHLNYLTVSPWRGVKDIKKGKEAIDAALGTNHKIYPFRPPYGKLNIVCLLYLIIKKVPVVYWTDDSGDTWKIKPGCDRIATIVQNSRGSVTILHDFNRSGPKMENWVLEAVRLALNKANEKRMNVVTVSELDSLGQN